MRWPRPDRQQRVDRAHADVEHLVDRLAVQRVDGRRGKRRIRSWRRAGRARRAAGRTRRARGRAIPSPPADAWRPPSDRRSARFRADRRARRATGRSLRWSASGTACRRRSRRLRLRPSAANCPAAVRSSLRRRPTGRSPTASSTRPAARVRRPQARIGRAIALRGAQCVEMGAPGVEVRVAGERRVRRGASGVRGARCGRRGIAACRGERAGRMTMARIVRGGRPRCGRRARIRWLGAAAPAAPNDASASSLFERRQVAGADLLDGRLHHVLALPSAAATRSQRVSMLASTSPVPAWARQPPRSTAGSVRTDQPRACSSSIRYASTTGRSAGLTIRCGAPVSAGSAGEHFAGGGNQRGRIVLHMLAHHLLRDIQRERDQRFRDFVLRAVECGLEGFGQRGEARGFFARFALRPASKPCA